MPDCRGVRRGSCNEIRCTCDGYDGGLKMRRCIKCQHPPGKHENLSKSKSKSSSPSLSSTKEDTGMVTFSVGPKSICKEDDLVMSHEQNYMGCQKDDTSEFSLRDFSVPLDADGDCYNTVVTKSDSSQQQIFSPLIKSLTLQQSPVSNFQAAPLPSLYPSYSSPSVDQSDIFDTDQDSELYSSVYQSALLMLFFFHFS